MSDGATGMPLTPHLTEQEHNDLLDGHVPPDDLPRLEAHLDDCERCRATHDDLRSLLALARASRHTAVPPEELWSLVSACTVHERAVRRQLVRSARTPIAGVALVVATLSATAGAVAERNVLHGTAVGANATTGSESPDAAAATGDGPSDAVRPVTAGAAATQPSVQGEKPMSQDSVQLEPLPADPTALRARAAAIDVRIREAVKTAASLASDSDAYRELADLYAERRQVMDALRAAR